MFYTRALNEQKTDSCVAVRTSHNLLNWSGPKIVHKQPLRTDYLEMPNSLCYKFDNLYYLFRVYALQNYNRTCVYWSRQSNLFRLKITYVNLPAHASELIYDQKKDGL